MKKIISVFCIAVFAITALHANPQLIGTWTADVESKQAFDTYKISFTADGRCTVKVSNDNAEQETAGNWSYNGTLFKLNATFRNAKLSYLRNIQWSSVLNFTADNNSFTILNKNATSGKITFFRGDGGNDLSYNDKAIARVFDDFSKDIPARSRLAIVGITATDPDEATFYVNELTIQFVNSKKYTVVDRNDVDKVLAEQDFQSAFADDDVSAFVSIGKFIGATVVVTGSIDSTGSQKRLVIKAIDVLTSEILAILPVAL
jgi:hypothetical protein